MKFVFDCDDTLYDLRWPFNAAMKETFTPEELAGIDLNDFYAAYRKYGDDIFHLIQDGTFTIDEAGLHRILHAAVDYHLDLTLEEAARFQTLYKQKQQETHMDQPIEDWMAQTGSDLYVLTNGPDSHQRSKLDSLQVEKYIPASHLFTSGQIGFAKPDIRAFAAVNPSPDTQDWIYIGDSYENDMEGAKAAGWQTIHFNRHHRRTGPAADHEVHTAEELTDLLRRLEAHG